jgi:hypothetical protein
VPLSALTSIRNIAGPEFTMRYNLYRSAQINASAAPGYSSAQVMRALEEVFAETMPNEMGYDYMGMSFQEQKAAAGRLADGHLCFSLLVRLPDPGGPVRELVAAVLGAARHADRRGRRLHRRCSGAVRSSMSMPRSVS